MEFSLLRDFELLKKVRNLGGDWISAIPIPGSFVCNIGDMLKVLVLPNCYLSFLNITFWEPFGESYMQILSNGVYESTLHRVINNSPLYRVCVAFFYEVANLSSTLVCFPSVTPHWNWKFHVCKPCLIQTNFDAVVEPFDICKDKYPEGRGESQIFKRAVYGEHLVSKVQTNFAM